MGSVGGEIERAGEGAYGFVDSGALDVFEFGDEFAFDDVGDVDANLGGLGESGEHGELAGVDSRRATVDAGRGRGEA